MAPSPVATIADQAQLAASCDAVDPVIAKRSTRRRNCIHDPQLAALCDAVDPVIAKRSTRRRNCIHDPQLAALCDAVDRNCIHDPQRIADAVGVVEQLSHAVNGWHLDTLELSEKTCGRPLGTLALFLFDHLGLLNHFNMDRTKFKCFCAEIELGYSSANPYHNSAHAASVLYFMYFLLEHVGVARLVGGQFRPAEFVPDEVDPLTVMACLLAAAVHDYDHIGFTNDFLTKTSDPRAQRYNGQHVNEQHHVDAAFAVLLMPECNFLENLPSDEFQHLHDLVAELVLATDMASQKNLMKSFTDCLDTFDVSDEGGDVHADSFRPRSSSDATTFLKIAMVCADLGHLTLDWDIHVMWVQRLEHEFFAQGDKEKQLGIPISFLMDRNKPGVTETQTGFFDFVVIPFLKTFVRAAPRAEPMLQAALHNRQRWHIIEASKASFL